MADVNFSNRPAEPDSIFAALASAEAPSYSAGLLHVGGTREPVLNVAAATVTEGAVGDEGFYQLGADLKLRRIEDPDAHAALKERAAILTNVLESDGASLLYRDEKGRRFRRFES